MPRSPINRLDESVNCCNVDVVILFSLNYLMQGAKHCRRNNIFIELLASALFLFNFSDEAAPLIPFNGRYDLV